VFSVVVPFQATTSRRRPVELAFSGARSRAPAQVRQRHGVNKVVGTLAL